MTSKNTDSIDSIALIDDHPLVAGALAVMLERHLPQATFRSFVTMAEAVAAAADGWTPDAVVLDLHLPDCSGVTGLRQVRQMWPGRRVVVMSGMTERSVVLQCIDEGAFAYIPKNSSPEDLDDAIQTIISGRMYLPSKIMNPGAASSRMDVPSFAASHAGTTDGKPLTAKQVTVLELVIKGLSNKDIARELDVAEGTVKSHLNTIYGRLGVSNRIEAIVAATRLANQPGSPFDPHSGHA